MQAGNDANFTNLTIVLDQISKVRADSPNCNDTIIPIGASRGADFHPTNQPN